MIRDRVNSGLARARANGVEMGRGKRKDGTRSADEVRWGTAEMEKRILSLRNEGKGILKIGRELGVGTALVAGGDASLSQDGASKGTGEGVRWESWDADLLCGDQALRASAARCARTCPELWGILRVIKLGGIARFRFRLNIHMPSVRRKRRHRRRLS